MNEEPSRLGANFQVEDDWSQLTRQGSGPELFALDGFGHSKTSSFVSCPPLCSHPA